MKTELKLFSVDYVNFKRNAHADIYFSPELFSADSIEYNHDLARLCSQLTMIGYDLPWSEKPEPEDSGIHKVFSALGFKNIETHSETDRNEIDCSFSSMDTIIGGEETRLVFACLVGSRRGQWYENFDSGKGKVHKGFAECEKYVYNLLSNYIDGLKKDGKKMKILISGHSRGGATSDLLAAHLIKDENFAEAKDIFTYTFAAPAAYKGDEPKEKRFSRIFNIVNDEDFVTRCMPAEWGYERYGITLSLPNKSNSSDFGNILGKVNKFYAEYTEGKEYHPFKKGPKTVNKLFKKLCAAVPDIDSYYDKKFNFLGSECSVKEYFFKTLCAITGEIPGSQENQNGTKLMTDTFLKRYSCAGVFKTIADFFVIYEGISGATNGKISDIYFSYGHDICTYCAFMTAISEKELIRK